MRMIHGYAIACALTATTLCTMSAEGEDENVGAGSGGGSNATEMRVEADREVPVGEAYDAPVEQSESEDASELGDETISEGAGEGEAADDES